MDVTAFVFYFSLLTSGVSFFYGKNLFSKPIISFFVILLLSSFLADFANELNTQVYLNFDYNLGFVHAGVIYRLSEFVLVGLLLIKVMELSDKLARLVNILIFILPIWFLIDTRFLSVEYDYTMLRLSSAVLAIFIALVFFNRTITKMEIPNIDIWPPLYFVGGLFLYFSGVLISFFLYTPIYNISPEAAESLWAFHNGLVALRNIMFLVGFYFTYKYQFEWN